MQYCTKCGKELHADAHFCASCGTAVEGSTNTGEKRIQTFVGEIRKCVHCGCVLDGFTAICPSCGFEVTSKHVSKAIIDFTNRLHAIGEAIAEEESNTKAFWTSWGIGKKIGYVILNINTLCIPLLLHIVFDFLRSFRTKNLTVNEKIKKDLIENFVVPNNKEDIMEFLLFAKAQRDKEHSLFDMKAHFWIGVWNNKCEQIIEKASALFASDISFISFLNEQKLLAQTIKKKRAKNALGMAAIVIVGIVGLPSFFVIRDKISLNRIPQEKILSPSSISITGDLADYYRTTGDSKLLFDKKKFTVTMVTEVEAIKDIQPEIDTQIDAFLKIKKWKRSDCQIDLHAYHNIGDNLTVNGDSVKKQKDMLEAILKLKKGETKPLTLIFTVENKENAADLMSKAVCLIDGQLEYVIRNFEKKDSEVLEIK